MANTTILVVDVVVAMVVQKKIGLNVIVTLRLVG